MLLIELLRYAAHGADDPSGLGGALRTTRDAEFQWLMDSGLAPYALDAIGSRVEAVPRERREQLVAADLVARVRAADQAETAGS